MAAANQDEGKLMLSKPRGKPNDEGSETQCDDDAFLEERCSED